MEPCPTGHHTHATRKTRQGTDRPPPVRAAPAPGTPPTPGKTDAGLTAGAGSHATRRTARVQQPRRHGPTRGVAPRPLRGQSSRTRSRASSHPARGDAPPAGRPASGSYPRTAGNGPSAPTRMEDRRHAKPAAVRVQPPRRHGLGTSRDADPIPTTEHAPPCPCAAGPGNGAAPRGAAVHPFSLWPAG